MAPQKVEFPTWWDEYVKSKRVRMTSPKPATTAADLVTGIFALTTLAITATVPVIPASVGVTTDATTSPVTTTATTMEHYTTQDYSSPATTTATTTATTDMTTEMAPETATETATTSREATTQHQRPPLISTATFIVVGAVSGAALLLAIAIAISTFCLWRGIEERAGIYLCVCFYECGCVCFYCPYRKLFFLTDFNLLLE